MAMAIKTYSSTKVGLIVLTLLGNANIPEPGPWARPVAHAACAIDKLVDPLWTLDP